MPAGRSPARGPRPSAATPSAEARCGRGARRGSAPPPRTAPGRAQPPPARRPVWAASRARGPCRRAYQPGEACTSRERRGPDLHSQRVLVTSANMRGAVRDRASHRTDVLIVGAGLAGLYASLEAAPRGAAHDARHQGLAPIVELVHGAGRHRGRSRPRRRPGAPRRRHARRGAGHRRSGRRGRAGARRRPARGRPRAAGRAAGIATTPAGRSLPGRAATAATASSTPAARRRARPSRAR